MTTAVASAYLTAEEAAEYLGMTVDWLYREARAGRVPHIRLGRKLKFRREQLDAWMVARESGTIESSTT